MYDLQSIRVAKCISTIIKFNASRSYNRIFHFDEQYIEQSVLPRTVECKSVYIIICSSAKNFVKLYSG